MVDQYGYSNYNYQQDGQNQNYYNSDASYADYAPQNKNYDHFGQDDSNWYGNYANGEYYQAHGEQQQPQHDQQSPSDFDFNDPDQNNQSNQTPQVQPNSGSTRDSKMDRTKTTVDLEVKDKLVDAGDKKRSNSGEFNKQDIDIKIDKEEPIFDGPIESGSVLTQSMVQEMHDIKCNDGIMKVEIISNESKGVGMKKHTQYLIKGQDSLGEINCFRRYSEFLLFRDFLYSRYPGLYIPPIPTKQNKGNMTPEFINERQYYLNEFLIKLCEFPYICKTPEVQVFFRPKGKVDESFKGLNRTSTDFVLKWYLINVKVSNSELADSKVQQYNLEIMEYVKEQKILMDHLKEFKKHIKQIVPMKEEEMRYYKQFANFLTHYEEANEKCNDKDSKQIRLISGDSQANLKNKLDALSEEMINPFIHVRNWIKCEMMNLNALMDAISQKESCDSRKAQAQRRLADDQQTLEKLQNGKFQFKTMFKKQSEKQSLIHDVTMKIQQRKKDIENWDQIKRFLTIYLYERAIPHFKKKKNVKYVGAMQSFTLDELKNSKSSQNCWREFFELTQQYKNP